MDPHRLGEERSLALHRVIASRLRVDPAIRLRARDRIVRWVGAGTLHREHADLWLAVLDGPIEALEALLVDPTDEARTLRSVTPFAGEIEPRERWRIWREVRARLESSDAT